MNTSRLEAFSDGVFAVAITLLVLQFIVPVVESGSTLVTAVYYAFNQIPWMESEASS